MGVKRGYEGSNKISQLFIFFALIMKGNKLKGIKIFKH